MILLVEHLETSCYREKFKSALNYILRNSNGGVLKLDDLIQVATKEVESFEQSVRDILKEKHPVRKVPMVSCLIDGEPEKVNPIPFKGLDADAIRQAALHTIRAAGPSGLDAYAWRRLCDHLSLPQIICVSHLLVWVDENYYYQCQP